MRHKETLVELLGHSMIYSVHSFLYLKCNKITSQYFFSIYDSGYMAPEYALQGIFSIKSDVFSYGVLILEILTSHKNSGYQGLSSEYSIDLLTYVSMNL